MAEPVRTTPFHAQRMSPRDIEALEAHERAGGCTLQRWVELPGGSFELWEAPLTPEDFLDPQIGDTMVQGAPHGHVAACLYELMYRKLHSRPDVLILIDVKHLLAPRKGPAPDVSIIRGLAHPDREILSFDLREQKIPPCLIIEVVSPTDRRIREVDERDKVKLYQRIGVEEYVLVDLPRRANRHRFRFSGYRLGPDRRYRLIEPDTQGRILSETTNTLFGVTADGSWFELFDATTGERMLSPVEAEEKAVREEQARREAEAENSRLRQEIERLRQG